MRQPRRFRRRLRHQYGFIQQFIRNKQGRRQGRRQWRRQSGKIYQFRSTKSHSQPSRRPSNTRSRQSPIKRHLQQCPLRNLTRASRRRQFTTRRQLRTNNQSRQRPLRTSPSIRQQQHSLYILHRQLTHRLRRHRRMPNRHKQHYDTTKSRQLNRTRNPTSTTRSQPYKYDINTIKRCPL